MNSDNPLAILNVCGVPGTLGFFAFTLHDQQLVLVSSYHVLFGDGAKVGDPVWLMDGQVLGHTLYGRLGNVRFAGRDVYLDCALAAVHLPGLPAGWRAVADERVATTVPAPGATAWKNGAATGLTEGTVVAAPEGEPARARGHAYDARQQILVRARGRARFSALGDSGAALRNESGEITGLLRGINTRGDTIVAPIAPVLFVLNVRVARLVAADGTPTDH